MEGEGRQAAARVRWVAPALGISCSVMLLLIVVRVAMLQAMPPEPILSVLEARERQHAISVPRADVLDRRGRPLAVSRYVHRVFFDPVEVAQQLEKGRISVDELAAAMAWMTGEDDFDIDRRIQVSLAENRDRRRAIEAYEAGGQQGEKPKRLIRYVRVGGFLNDHKLAIVRSHPLPGIHLEREAIRDRVGGELASAIVGKVGSDPQFSEGLERTMRERLEGEAGAITYTHDAKGRPLWIARGAAKTPEPAAPLYLSLDLEIQRIARAELRRAVEDADAAGGMVIVLDPSTGEVLAMADVLREVENEPYPWADDRVPKDEWPRRVDLFRRFEFVRPDPLREQDAAIARNRVVEDAYEPGSTFKAFVWAALTDGHPELLDRVFEPAPGGVTFINGRRLSDVRANGEQTWAEVLVNSSNIGMATAAQEFTPAEFRASLERFGIGEPPRVGLPDEAHGTLRSLKNWNDYTHVSIAFGQEVTTSVAQVARAYSAFARNGSEAGTVPALRLSAVGVNGPDGLVARRAVSPEAAMATRTVMVQIAEKLDEKMRGEGPFEYSMFGKSGTAQVAPERTEAWHRRPPGARGYLERQYVSSFVAGAPLDRPRIVVMVSVEDPGPETIRRNQYYGSSVAGPAVRRIVERVLPYLGVEPDRETADASSTSALANAR
ncbi:MAG: penicillin-binding protein 2 [Phycisphaerales bacterium]|jgi:cell division protein FtsI (penicillin-binding protein 3)